MVEEERALEGPLSKSPSSAHRCHNPADSYSLISLIVIHYTMYRPWKFQDETVTQWHLRGQSNCLVDLSGWAVDTVGCYAREKTGEFPRLDPTIWAAGVVTPNWYNLIWPNTWPERRMTRKKKIQNKRCQNSVCQNEASAVHRETRCRDSGIYIEYILNSLWML